jgi:predicted dienelactone hydrolase
MRGFAIALMLAFCAPHAAARVPVGVTMRTFTKTYPAVRGTGTAEALGLRDATVRRGRFPLVVFSHGSCGSPTEATYFSTALASRGFVVAAPPHPGNTVDEFPACAATGNFLDSVANRVPDVMFTIDSMLAEPTFAKRLRSGPIGMSGLSFGGFTALFAEQRDPRIAMALAMVPGGVEFLDQGGIPLPTMVIGAEHDRVVGFPESQTAFAHLSGPRFLVELLGGDHLSVVDDCGLLCTPALSQDDAHRLVLRYALPFFRRYLAGDRHAGRALRRQVPGVVVTAEP